VSSKLGAIHQSWRFSDFKKASSSNPAATESCNARHPPSLGIMIVLADIHKNSPTRFRVEPIYLIPQCDLLSSKQGVGVLVAFLRYSAVIAGRVLSSVHGMVVTLQRPQ